MDPRVGLSWLHEGLSPDQLGQFAFRSGLPQNRIFPFPRPRLIQPSTRSSFTPARSSFQPDKSFALFPGMTISMRVTGSRAEVFINDRYKIYDGPYGALVTAAKQSTCPRWTSPYGMPVCDGSLLLESARGRAVKIASSMNLKMPAAGFID